MVSKLGNPEIFSSILSQDVIRPFEVVGCSFARVFRLEGEGIPNYLPQQASMADQSVPKNS